MRHEVTALHLTPSSGGAFEIFKDDKKIYSKLETGRFPRTEDVIRELKN